MENTNFNFALDVQEKVTSLGCDFIEGLKTVIEEYLKDVDVQNSTNDTLFFKDGSGCKFEGHNIVLV